MTPAKEANIRLAKRLNQKDPNAAATAAAEKAPII